jgi:hypothetical protein
MVHFRGKLTVLEEWIVDDYEDEWMHDQAMTKQPFPAASSGRHRPQQLKGHCAGASLTRHRSSRVWLAMDSEEPGCAQKAVPLPRLHAAKTNLKTVGPYWPSVNSVPVGVSPALFPRCKRENFIGEPHTHNWVDQIGFIWH